MKTTTTWLLAFLLTAHAASSAQELIVLKVPSLDTQINRTPIRLSSAGSRPEKINLLNPSFELDEIGVTAAPRHWYYLGSCEACTPVIEPGVQEKRKKAPDGKNFVALLAVDNGKTEIIGQRLEYPLERDSVYTFQITASKATRYKAYPSDTDSPVNFNTPVVLRVWGYNDGTEQQELLGQTVPIDHEFWYEYKFLLTPTQRRYDSIGLEAGFDNRKKRPYNGNVLLDKCSPIVRMPQ